MRIRPFADVLVVGALTLGTLSVIADVSHAERSGGLPGSVIRFAPHVRTARGGTAGPEPGLSTAGRPGRPLLPSPRLPSPLLRAAPVTVSVAGYYSWALLDRTTGRLAGSANSEETTSSTESMIKVWIASDYLRRLPDGEPDQDRLDELSRMIRDSDDIAAEDVYQRDGGDDVVQRMIDTCGLSDTSLFEGWWSRTEVTARDAVRLGLCVTDGRAAGPRWSGWVLGEMRKVRGEGRFGIIDALPTGAAARTGIKNGWTVVGDEWHVNCLAVVDQYVLAVLTRYPESLGLSYGAGICRSVATQLRGPTE